MADMGMGLFQFHSCKGAVDPENPEYVDVGNQYIAIAASRTWITPGRILSCLLQGIFGVQSFKHH
jgi:hypothetical protein